jgi:hypothetical protein
MPFINSKPNKFIIEGLICKIECYDINGDIRDYGIIDVWNIEKCKPYKWYFDGKYIVSTKYKLGDSYQIYLHKIIINIQSRVDHINQNRKDCRELNLRPATQSQNGINRGPQKNNTSGYKGVYLDNRYNKWSAKIKKNGKQINLGLFVNKEDAALVYNENAIKLFGEFAYLNKIKPNFQICVMK